MTKFVSTLTLINKGLKGEEALAKQLQEMVSTLTLINKGLKDKLSQATGLGCAVVSTLTLINKGLKVPTGGSSLIRLPISFNVNPDK